ncbi:MAG: CPBP family intramembrane glutamic endopeptidase [Verrucomicrobiota bacterium]
MTLDATSPEPTADRPAAWWSWPLILFSVFFIGWSVNLFAPAPAEGTTDDAQLVNAGDLALFKMQSQIVIAAAPLSPNDAVETLEELRSLVQNDAMVLAFALLEDFLELDGTTPEKTLEQLSPDGAPKTRVLVEKALESGITSEERETLAESLGWFAQLARGEGGAAPPLEKGIRLQALAFLGIASFVFIGVVFGVVAGAILLILQHRDISLGRKTHRFSASEVPRGVLLECFALYLGIMAFGELGGIWIHTGISYASYLLAVIIPFLWPRWRGVSGKDFRRSLGWHRGEGIWREIGAGFVGYFKVIAIASIGVFLTLVLSAVVGSLGTAGEAESAAGGEVVGPETHPIVGWIYLGGWLERLLCLFLAAVFAPIFEEIFFRGALHRWFRGRIRFIVSALLTGAIFAALHPQGWLGIPALAAMGVGFSLLRESRDSLIAPMVAHSINNGVLVAILCFAL